MDKFLKDLESGDIHFRDRWQFELKSDFTPVEGESKTSYKQEIYLFIPNTLQINNQTYPKDQFYRDQTNWIRYKTPVMSLKSLSDPTNTNSPLYRVNELLKQEPNNEVADQIAEDLKLCGNIVRSAIRKRIATIIHQLGVREEDIDTTNLVLNLCEDMRTLHQSFLSLKTPLLNIYKQPSILKCFGYVDEFISKTIDYYCCGLLAEIRRFSSESFQYCDDVICELINEQKQHRISLHDEEETFDSTDINKEFILYRNGLLNKYVQDPLMLEVNRSALGSFFQNIIGSLAAGIAMLFYFVLFIWQGEVFLINSAPFVVVTVLLYVIKDRLKEGIKNLSAQHAFKWFSDYGTDIKPENEEVVLGQLKESFSFVDEKSLPSQIKRIRNKEFHQMVTFFKRPESVIYYKKSISIVGEPFINRSTRHGLNIIFRLNIQQYLAKAGNPQQSYLTLVPGTNRLTTILLPKIYHLNMIMKNKYMGRKGKMITEFKKFRLVVDKNGIKQVEKVYLTDSSKE